MKARPHIRAALDRQGELRLYEEEDLLAMVLRGDASLWLYGDSAVVAEIAQYPRCRSVFFRAAGGNLEDIGVLQHAVEEWAAREYGVAFSEFIGRKGWLRTMGFTEGPACGWKRIER